MRNQGRRLDASLGALDAKKRVFLTLKALKAGEKPDESFGPAGQVEYKRIFSLIVGANRLAERADILSIAVSELETRHQMILRIRTLAAENALFTTYIRGWTKEPITESDYRRREQVLTAKVVPVGDLVDIAVELYMSWTDADYEDAAGARVLRQHAKERALKETEASLIELVRNGTLIGEVNESGVFAQVGSFYKWLCEPVPIVSEKGYAYEVVSDREAARVAAQLVSLKLVEDSIARCRDELPTDSEMESPISDHINIHSVLKKMDVIAVRDGIEDLWRHLRAIEIEVSRLADKECFGEDPLLVETREILENIGARLVSLRNAALEYVEINLPEPDSSVLRMVRKQMRPRGGRS